MPPTGGKSKGNKKGDTRNTTPLSTTSNDQTSNMGDTTSMSYDQLLKEHGSSSSPPPVSQMKKMLESLKAFSDVAKLRSETCDKGMREYSKKRKELSESTRQREFEAKQAEEDRKQKLQKKNKLKKEQEQESQTEKEREEAARPLAVGAHALAPQDGSAAEGKPSSFLNAFHRHTLACYSVCPISWHISNKHLKQTYTHLMGQLDDDNAALEALKKTVQNGGRPSRPQRRARGRESLSLREGSSSPFKSELSFDTPDSSELSTISNSSGCMPSFAKTSSKTSC